MGGKSMKKVLTPTGYIEVEEETIEIPKPPYKERVVARIREKYSVDDELQLINEQYKEPEKYSAYRAYVEQVKVEERGV